MIEHNRKWSEDWNINYHFNVAMIKDDITCSCKMQNLEENDNHVKAWSTMNK